MKFDVMLKGQIYYEFYNLKGPFSVQLLTVINIFKEITPYKVIYILPILFGWQVGIL